MAGPTRHSGSEYHRSTDDATGTNITSGYVMIAQGDGTVAWGTAGAADAELNIEGGQDVIKVHGSMGSTETFDPTDGNVHTGTLNADCTFTLNAPTGTGASTLELWITQDGTGGWGITWPASVTSNGTISPDTTAGGTVRYILETVDTGTNWILDLVGGGGQLWHPSASSNSFSVVTNDASMALTQPVAGTLQFSAPFYSEVVTDGGEIVWYGDDVVHSLVRIY